MPKSQGTDLYVQAAAARGIPASAYRKLGRTGWSVSAIGFGTYRVEESNPDHGAALREALLKGCNLIDTSTNYTGGGSERTIGGILNGMEGRLPGGRDGIVVVSKVGYVQGANLALAQSRSFPDMVKYSEDCWHCVHPEYIELQLTGSLDRLGANSLDVYLLHNPEYFFSDADNRKSPVSLEDRRAEFYRRIRAAFLHLENEVARGRIRHYGVSSNTFGLPKEDTEFTSLTEMWRIAEGISENHHFSVAQLPANLLETGPFLNRNNGEDAEATVVDFARARNLGVLVNRPLNAISGNQLYRLTDFPEPEGLESVGDCLHAVAEWEERFAAGLGSTLQFRTREHTAKDLFKWSVDLVPERTERLSPDQWAYLESQVILPQTHDLLQQLTPAFGVGQKQSWNDWQRDYLTALAKLLAAIRYKTTAPSRTMAAQLANALDRHLADNAKGATLSQKALATLAFTEGVSCVLNGMRRINYVEDSLEVLRMEPWDVTETWYRDLNAAL